MFKFRCIKSSELPIKVTTYKQFNDATSREDFLPARLSFPSPAE